MHRLEFFFLSFPFFFKLFLPNQFDDGWFIDSPPIYWPLFFFFCTPFEWLCSISNDFLFNRVVSFFSLSLSLSDSAGKFFYLLGIFFHTHIFIFWYLCVECIESFKFLVKFHFFSLLVLLVLRVLRLHLLLSVSEYLSYYQVETRDFHNFISSLISKGKKIKQFFWYVIWMRDFDAFFLMTVNCGKYLIRSFKSGRGDSKWRWKRRMQERRRNGGGREK